MKQELLEIGFKELSHFTVTDALIYDLGRNRQLSFQCAGTPNEMLWISELDEDDKRKVADAVCLRNYDYDGYTSIEDIKNIIKSIIKITKTDRTV